MTVIYTGGTFDLFHSGHIEILNWCSTFGKVVVGLNTDQFVEKFKGNRPVMSYSEREAVLKSCKFVTKVVENFGNEDSKVVIERVRPNIVAIGSDWHGRDYLSQMNFDWSWLHEHFIALMYIPRLGLISSTSIKERITR